MSKKDVAAVMTLAGAGVWLWRKWPNIKKARVELEETGRIDLPTLIALSAMVVSAAALWPGVRDALRQLGQS